MHEMIQMTNKPNEVQSVLDIVKPLHPHPRKGSTRSRHRAPCYPILTHQVVHSFDWTTSKSKSKMTARSRNNLKLRSRREIILEV